MIKKKYHFATHEMLLWELSIMISLYHIERKEWLDMLENLLYQPSTSLRLVALFHVRRICHCSIGQKQFLHRAAYGAPQALAASNTRLPLVFNGIGFANASVFTSSTWRMVRRCLICWQPTLILRLWINSEHQKSVFGNFQSVTSSTANICPCPQAPA